MNDALWVAATGLCNGLLKEDYLCSVSVMCACLGGALFSFIVQYSKCEGRV